MRSDREEELARTATAAASATVVAAEPVGATLGRYRLERELGAGAMGVVHAAFDPDLERRIALKVLRGTATPEARDRLLREARAMARLTHPNVVTVHEVGTASGRDFVAMELIHGETLAEWLRAGKRTPAAILDALLAAGRGLAAAHAAGIVHRDFKPHNVLRSRDGRIVVTDFGLAREADGAMPPALEMTLPVGAATSSSSTPSALAGLTVTGSLLGTPAYMAPEQWQGGAVTPATDQFAYCVALWEALAGERPYPGPTFDDLRSQVARGPTALDASRIPRRVRGLLRRGLDPDPARRWPSMDALLGQLARAQRRPGVALVITGGALVAAVALVFALRPGPAPAPTCEPPVRDAATVWSPAISADLRAKTSAAHEAVFAAAFRDWQTARTTACAARLQVRQAQLSCLDGVLGRFDALRHAFIQVPGAAAEEIQAQLIDPTICRKSTAAEMPRLTLAPNQDVIRAYELLARSSTEAKPTDDEIARLTDASLADPCARVIATLAFDAASQDVWRKRSRMNSAPGLADQCGDERLRADLLIASVPYQQQLPSSGSNEEAALKQADVAANRVLQPDLAAAVAALHRRVAWRQKQWSEVFRLLETEIKGYGARGLLARQLKAVIARNEARIDRSDPADLEAVMTDVQFWHRRAVENHQTDLARRLDFTGAEARFRRGDVESAHADRVRLWQELLSSGRPTSEHVIEGEVVDDKGVPVAGATIAAALRLYADSIGIGLPIISNDESLRITTTDARGHFVLHDAPKAGAIAAQLAKQRSRPVEIADRVRLVIEPTRSVSGRVDFGDVPHTSVHVACYSSESALLSFTFAPVDADGSFSIQGVTRGAVIVGTAVRDSDIRGVSGDYRQLPASPMSVVDLALAIRPSTRALDIVVRSAAATALDGAAAWVLPGNWPIKRSGDLLRSPMLTVPELYPQPVGDSPPANLAGRIRHGDLLQHVDHVARGELTVCAFSYPGERTDPDMEQRMIAHLSDLAVKCEHIGPDASVVVLEVPPQQNLH